MTSIHLTEETNQVVLNPSSVQVKMFIHHDLGEAERAVSNWLRHQDVSIRHLAQSQSEKGGKFVFVLTVFYRQND